MNKITKKKKIFTSSNIQLTLMALPCAILFILLKYVPMTGLIMAFKNYIPNGRGFFNSLIHSKWVGLENFKFLFATSDVAIAVRNTLLYNGCWIILGVVLPVIFAIMLNEVTNKKSAKLYQTLMLFPHFLSWVIVASFVFAFLSHERGFINSVVEMFGGERVMWYSNGKYWPFILTIMNIWKTTGYNGIVYLAAICGIDETLYEAARIDGATRLQQIKNVTIPMLMPMIFILTIMAIGRIFAADFGLFYNVPMASSTGALKNSVLVVDTYVYNAMTTINNFGMSTAAGLAQSFIGLIMIISANTAARKINPDYSLF